MRKRPPIDLKQLHRTTVRMRGGRLRRASVLPFFDREGVVHAVVLVWPGSDEILVIDHTPDLLHVSWRGYVDLSARAADLLDARGPVLEKLTKLWHWDPWWMLTKKPWRVHSAVEALKRTNSVESFDLPIRACYTDLAVTKIFFEAKGGGEPRLPESPVHEPNRSLEPEEPEAVHAEVAHARPKAAPAERTAVPPSGAVHAAPAREPAPKRPGSPRSDGWRLRPLWEKNWPPKIRDGG